MEGSRKLRHKSFNGAGKMLDGIQLFHGKCQTEIVLMTGRPFIAAH